MRLTFPLPKGFVLGKPIKPENYDPQVLLELEQNGRLVITRKRDGYKLYAVIDQRGKVEIYTAKMNRVDARLDHLCHEIKALKLPSGTLLVGEGLMDVNGHDDFGLTVAVFKSSLEKSLEFQKNKGLLNYMIFDIIALEGRVVEVGYLERLICLQFWRLSLQSLKLRYLSVVPVLTSTLVEAQERVHHEGWEGLVLYDSDFVNVFRLDGKDPHRPSGCYKWKPIREDDFIVRRWIPHPDHPDRLKELVLLQIDPETRGEFECGKLGTFDNKTRGQLRRATYPLVVQVAFEVRFPKSGKIRHARFMRVRNDKPLGECVAPQSYVG